MTSEQAIKQFWETYAEARCRQAFVQTEDYYHKHKEQLVAEMAQQIIAFLRHIKMQQEIGAKASISYIFCSFLYSAFMQSRPIWRWDAYDKSHYLDEQECTGYFDTPWLFAELNAAYAELDQERRKYVGKINVAYLDIIKRQQAYYYSIYPTVVIRQALKEVVKSEEFAAIQKGETVEFRLGEYHDVTEVVYSHKERKQDSAKIKAWLEKKFDDKYFTTCLTDLELSNGDYSLCNLSYARLTNSTLKHVNLQESLLYGTDFSHCCIEDSDFSHSWMSGASFTEVSMKRTRFYHCMASETAEYDDSEQHILVDLFSETSFCKGQLTDVEFFYASLDQADFTGATLHQVSFASCSLIGACFKNTILMDCDFTNADATEATFLGATLTRCKFSKEVDSTLFTAEQRQQLILS